MGSKLFAAAGGVSASARRLVAARPWLSGTTALAAVTVALFAWFLTERWDDVEVTAVASTGQLVNGSSRLASPGTAGEEQSDRRMSSTAIPDEVGLDALSVSHEWTTAAGGMDFAIGEPPGDEPATERMAARIAGSAPGPRGAWLTGTIETSAEDETFRVNEPLDGYSPFYPAQARRW